MSDFLDRLAARAIGSETTLAPRLPSLFEPLQRAPIMPLSDDGDTSSRRREAVSVATATAVAPMHSPPAPLMAMTDVSRAAPATATAVPAAAPAASAPRSVVQPAPIAAAPVSSPAVECTPAPPAPPPSPAAFVPRPVQPRQTRIAPQPPESASSSYPPNGALLPVPAPVFGTTRAADASGRSIHAAALRTTHAEQAGKDEPAREPVVHVSIGRLEVRAAPAAATPPRRRDGPQPSSLDDYLRQRGGKASP